jgi:hypothetical protein
MQRWLEWDGAERQCLGSHAAAARLSQSLLHERVESDAHMQPVVVAVVLAGRLQRVLAVASSCRLMASEVRRVQRQCGYLAHAQRLRASSSDVRVAALQRH